jgi:hypothetical protein
MLDGRGADERVVHCSAGDAKRAEPGQQLGGRLITEKTRRGKVVGYETATAPGLLRAGGGNRVRIENVSNAAWPARPSVLLPTASTTA